MKGSGFEIAVPDEPSSKVVDIITQASFARLGKTLHSSFVKKKKNICLLFTERTSILVETKLLPNHFLGVFYHSGTITSNQVSQTTTYFIWSRVTTLSWSWSEPIPGTLDAKPDDSRRMGYGSITGHHVNTSTPSFTSRSYLSDGRKPVNPEEAHADMNRTCDTWTEDRTQDHGAVRRRYYLLPA